MFNYKSFLVAALSFSTTSLYSIDANHISAQLHKNFQTGNPAKVKTKQHAHISWQEVTMPTEERSMFIISMKDSTELYAYNNDGSRPKHPSPGLLQSNDQGRHWHNVTLPGNVPIWDMVSLDANHLAVINEKGVYLSADKGAHWNKSENGLPQTELFKQILSTDADTLYVVGRSNVYRSLNGGENWEPASFNLAKESKYYWHLAAKNDLLIVNLNGRSSDELYLSTNRGDHWYKPSSKWKFKRIAATALNSKHEIFVHTDGHLYKTDIYGKYLTQLDNNIPETSYEPKILIDDKDRIYYLIPGFPSVLYRSEDNGNTWELLQKFEKNSKYDESRMHSQGFNILQDGRVAAVTGYMTLLSDDTQRHFSPILSMPVERVVNIAKVQSQLFIATSSFRYGVHNLYQSNEASLVWKLSRPQVASVANLNNQLVIVDNEGKAQLSDDIGQTWKETFQFQNNLSMNLSSSNTRIWANSPEYFDNYYPGAFISSNGQDWLQFYNKKIIQSVYAEEDIIYLTDGVNLKKSKDNGMKWKNILTLSDGPRTFLRGYASDLILLAVNGSGLIKSTDGGKNWHFIQDGLNNWAFEDLVILDANNYVLANDSGVFATNDGGKTWNAANTGLKSLLVKRLFYKGGVLYAATKGSGVYKAVWK